MPTAWKGTTSFGLVSIPITPYPAFKSKEMGFMPAKNAENLYVLLRAAIMSSGMIGVGKIQFGNREHLAALKADGPAILLNLMHFVEELEDPKLLNFPPLSAAVGKKELELARQLVTTLRESFDPEGFRDIHRARLEETLREKVEKEAGHRRRRSGRPGGDRKVIDLVDPLKESLERGGLEHSKARSKRRPVAPAHAGSHVQGERPYRRRKVG